VKIALLGAYPILHFAKELGISRPAQNTTSWNVNLAKGLAKLPGNEVHFISMSSSIPQDQIIKSDGVKIHFLSCPRKVRFLTLFQYNKKKIHNELKRIKPDIVHGHGTEHEYPYVAATSTYPRVITVHCVLKDLLRTIKFPIVNRLKIRIFLLLETYTLERASHVIITTEYMKGLLNGGNCKIFVINNCINPAFFEYSQIVEKADNKLIFVGRISREKGIEHLVRCFLFFFRRFSGVKLSIFGKWVDKGYLDEIKSFIVHNNLQSNIIIKGLEDPNMIPMVMSDATALILPSNYDAFGLVLAEAMAVGTPVIASRVGGIPYVVDDGKTGFLVEPGNAQALAEKILVLLENKSLREKMGEKAKDTALRRFHPSVVAKKHMDVYEAILKNWHK